jgi:predicted acetyltransferase
MRLVKYNEVSQKEYEDYITEWENAGEDIIPGASNPKGRSFDEMVNQWIYDETDAPYERGFVPGTLFFMVDEHQRIIGAIHLRHTLNERLRQHGGHIGYGIRPSERKKGYASFMLKIFLEDIRKKGFDKVLLTCDEENIASQRTIESNGGVLEEKLLFDEIWTRKYWINLNKD